MSSFKYDILRDCALLEKNKSFSNLFDIICSHSDIPAAIWLENDEEKSLTFSQLSKLSDNYAARLSELFGNGGRVCISLDSCKEWFPLFWGLIRSAHDVLLLDASMPDAKAEYLLEQTQCVGLVSGKRHNLPERYKQVLISELADCPDVIGYKSVWANNIALCTSGTTSNSRIFVYDDKAICTLALFSASLYKQNHRLVNNDTYRTLAFLPFHHVLGFSAIFIWSHFTGYTTVYLKDRSPVTISKTARKTKVNQIIAVPLLANSISRSLNAEIQKQGILERSAFKTMLNLSLALQSIAPKEGLRIAHRMFGFIQKKVFGTNIKCIILGGSHTDAESLRLLNGIGYYTICGFGMTETAITSLESSLRLKNRLLGCIGNPLGDTEYRIKPLDTEKDGQVKGNEQAGNGKPGRYGELQVRGAGLHSARIIDGKSVAPDFDKDGWFSTGDIARYVEASKQYFIEGRLKDVIINESGENVYPDELEDNFMDIDGLKQYNILGLKKDCGRYEDIVLVMNVAEKINDSEFIAGLARSIRNINRNIPIYARITKALVVSEQLPVANGFKVKRLALKQMLESGSLAYTELNLSPQKDDSLASSGKPVKTKEQTTEDKHTEELTKMVLSIFSQVLNIPADKIDVDSNFIEDLGGDSLQVLSIIVKAEETFNVMIPTESYQACATVNGAVGVLKSLLYGGAEEHKGLVERTPVSDFEKTVEYEHFRIRKESLTGDGSHNPYFVVHDSPLLDKSIVNGKEYLDFGSYNYVGMSGRKEVNDAAKAAIDRWGTSASGSRLLAGEKPVHAQLEKAIAQWKNAESALVLVGGHSTNVTVVGNFCGKNDLILYDALAHNSIEQGCRLSEAAARPFPHNDLESLEQILKTQRKYFEKVLIVIEGVYSMDGDVSNVPAFVDIKKRYGCFLMVDEAHSSCVLGAHGGGVDEYFNLEQNDIDIKYGTLSKGLGTCGGYVAGRASLIEYFRYNLPGFVFSVGLSPALAAGSLEAIRLLRSDSGIMENLHRNIKCFAQEARKRNLNICLAGESAILPVLVGADADAVALSNEMENRGILVPPALYPAVPKNKARLRFDVISEHKPEQIIYALDTLVQAAKDLGIVLPS